MKALTSRTSLAALGALALGAVLATAQPAAAAVVSDTGPLRFLELGSEATIDAKGAVVFAAVTVTCDRAPTAASRSTSPRARRTASRRAPRRRR